MQTGADGTCVVPVVDPALASKTEATGSVRVKKPHHGPVAAAGTAFASGEAAVRVKFTPGPDKLEVLDLPAAQLVRWGRPRVVGEPAKILELTLVEGGTLGKLHTAVRTRRLSAAHRPETPSKPVSQIDEELIFHIAHCDLALTPSTDYVFTHDLSLPDCVIQRSARRG
jgi:hypothetical protein